MNEHLSERLSRSRKPARAHGTRPEQAEVWILPPKLNTRIREYFQGPPAEGGGWLERAEIPTTAELMDTDTITAADGSSSSDIVELVPNKPKGPWGDKEAYLSAHYELLREDALQPLREAVSKVRITPQANEDAFMGQLGIYEKVHICATTISTRGIAIRVTFSLRRTGKQILWEQSKRLISGSLVVLTPTDDMFQKKAIVATVAARPLSALQQNPPEVDLFFARTEELEIDPAVEYAMVEERSGFYEASRHTLLALQHMMKEPFPLSEHLVHARPEIAPPRYLVDQPRKDLTSVFRNNKHQSYEDVDILKHWPPQPESDMDASQLRALNRILTKRLAIVQGPPGTGKTFVSVQAIKVMLANRKEDDPPIVLACQTNHALDHLLRHVAQFEPDFVRLGGRSKDQDVIKKRTLYELRMANSENPPAGCSHGMARKKMQDMQKDFGMILTPLCPDKKALDHRLLENFKLLTKAQADSLESGASQWVQDKKTNPNEARTPFTIWLGDKLVSVPSKQQPEEFGFDFEEADLEFEQLKEMEAENMTKDDEDFETLSGLPLSVADNFTCRKVQSMEPKGRDLLSKYEDLWKIPDTARGAVYRYLQAELKVCIRTAFREKAKQYNEQAMKRRIGQWEMNENIIKKQKIIGLTTTGLSKYRPLIAALQPKVVLIEEAAETLEAPVTVACMPSVQHLILVGDHQQLRPHTQVKTHEGNPWFLNISLFERMINNKVGFEILVKQRRMIPEIRRVLYPIYGNQIKDHASVLDPKNRPDVPGMGGINSFFFTHQWPEARDDQMSCYNQREVDMIVGFFQHLRYNGMSTQDITVLTFYNGQRKRILAELRRSTILSSDSAKFNVVTVDSYQGEENKVVILSLVRSNDKHQIGFLNIDNRVCVALSRAQCGFYIFGNGMLLHDCSTTWRTVVKIMANKKKRVDPSQLEPSRLGSALPVTCSKHATRVEIATSDDWVPISGGCKVKCEGKLPCGHSCTLTCHPFPHEDVICSECPRRQLGPAPGDGLTIKPQPTSDSQSAESKSTHSSWNSYSQKEPKRIQEQVGSYESSPSKITSEQIEVISSKEKKAKKKHLPVSGETDSAGKARKKWTDQVRVGDGSKEPQAQAEEEEEEEEEEDLLL